MIDLREALAAVQHDIWAHWHRYVISVSAQNPDGSLTIPADKVERWARQMNTSYQELSEKERESDRDQADKILARLSNELLAIAALRGLD